MSDKLKGLRIAILATDGVEEIELTQPWQALEAAGAEVDLVAPQAGKIQAMNQDLNKGREFEADVAVSNADSADYHGLMLPGGVANPDKLRLDKASVDFAAAFFTESKPVAAICHAPWTLVEAGVVEGRTLTSFPSLKTDIINAGGNWVDDEVHVDSGFVTSRSPDDLNAFCSKAVEEFCEGRHSGQTA